MTMCSGRLKLKGGPILGCALPEGHKANGSECAFRFPDIMLHSTVGVEIETERHEDTSRRFHTY